VNSDRKWLGQLKNKSHVCDSVSHENTRLLIPDKYLERHIDPMGTHHQGSWSELVFEGVASLDRPDRRQKKVIVGLSVTEEYGV
jgi:hypothetical protein